MLINNTGIAVRRRQRSADGYESTFAVNHLAPFLLTNLLLDLLQASAPARIVNVSSGVHSSGQIDFADLQMERRFDGWQAYCNSKLANALFHLRAGAPPGCATGHRQLPAPWRDRHQAAARQLRRR